MSDEMKPEVLPGDLISGPGVYISRSNCAVEVRGYDHGYWRAEWEDGARWYHSSGTQTGLPARDDPFQLVRWVGPLVEDIPTTSEQIAEIEGQQPELEPEPENRGFEGHILREQPQPVQVREGRWRTRGGEIRNVTPTPEDDDRVTQYPWYDAEYDQTWMSDGSCYFGEEHQRDLVKYLWPIEPDPEPQKIITPDDVAAEALAGVFDQGKAERQIAELRSEVSYVQGLLGESRQRVTQLEELVTSLRNINKAQEKAFEAAGKENTDLQHRLDTVAAEWAQQLETIRGLQTQLEAVKAELVQVSRDRYLLQVELDASEQVPQAVSHRWEESYNKGAARAVETIAEWTAPFRTCGSQGLAYHVMQNLPHIMRSLTGLADTED